HLEGMESIIALHSIPGGNYRFYSLIFRTNATQKTTRTAFPGWFSVDSDRAVVAKSCSLAAYLAILTTILHNLDFSRDNWVVFTHDS
ncbi:MAG: hypothetical protein WBG94_09875, partial [Anaerolineales bacterium]